MLGGGLEVCPGSARSVSWIGCPEKFCAGECRSRKDGVFLYWSSARVNLCLSRWLHVHAARITFFMDLTVDSAFPLLCGYMGEVVRL